MSIVKIQSGAYATLLWAYLGASGGTQRSFDGARSWTSVSGVAGGSYSQFYWITPNVGLCACTNAMYRTVDGGAHWTNVQAGYFYSVSMWDTLRGCAVGDSAIIYRTFDGGATWSSVGGAGLGIGTTSLTYVYCVPGIGNYVAYVCGARYSGNGVILRTANGGTTWSTQSSGVATDFVSIACDSSGTRATTGLCYSVNSGVNWSASSGNGASPNNMSVVSDAIFICGTSPTGAVYRSIDWGAHWAACSPVLNTPTGVTGLAVSGKNVWAGSLSRFMMSTDAGVSWTDLAPPGPIYELACSRPGFVVFTPSLDLEVV